MGKVAFVTNMIYNVQCKIGFSKRVLHLATGKVDTSNGLNDTDGDYLKQ